MNGGWLQIVTAVLLVVIGACQTGEPDRAVGDGGHESSVMGEADRVDVALSTLSVEFGCDEWFKIANPDRTLAFVLRAWSFDAEELRAETRLPSEVWSGEVWLGADLFAGNCGDVFDEDDPVQRIDEIWSVVSGDIVTLRLPEPEVGGPAVVELRDIVIRTADGTRSRMASLTIENPSFWISGGA